MDELAQLLAKGLQKGFAGGTITAGVERGGFRLESSHYEDNGAVYHDEWSAKRVGGGQELVKIGDKQYTRVYAGGTIAEAELQKLGITLDDVTKQLIGFILKYGDNVRLSNDFEPDADGDWQYRCTVIDREDDIPVLVDKEIISFKGTIVFVHYFILCPVE